MFILLILLILVIIFLVLVLFIVAQSHMRLSAMLKEQDDAMNRLHRMKKVIELHGLVLPSEAKVIKYVTVHGLKQEYYNLQGEVDTAVQRFYTIKNKYHGKAGKFTKDPGNHPADNGGEPGKTV